MAKAIKDTYTGLGGEIVAEATYQINDSGIPRPADHLAQSNPSYLFMPVMGYKGGGVCGKTALELGLGDIKLIGNYVCDTEDLLTLAGPSWRAVSSQPTAI